VFRRPLSVDLPPLRLDSALVVVGRVAGARFAYSRNTVPVERIVSVHATRAPLSDVLDSLLSGMGVDVVLSSSGQIALVRHRASARADSTFVTGVVADSATGVPISGAIVALEPPTAGTRTGPDGRYRLRIVPGELQAVRARALGFRPQDQQLVGRGGEEQLDFRLPRRRWHSPRSS